MYPFRDLLPPTPERVWLHRTQWRTVALLILLLGAVVASLALAAAYWWTLRVREVAALLPPPAAPRVVPVATITVPTGTPRVVEVYPTTVVHRGGSRVVVRSPGGTVTAVPVRAGQSLKAGQPLLRLVRRVPVPVPPQKPRPAAPRVVAAAYRPVDPSFARRRQEATALRRRLTRLRSEITKARNAEAAAAQPRLSPAGREALVTVRDAEADVREARLALRTAARRRRHTDRLFAARDTSRYKFHLNRSAELLAQIELRQAERAAEEVRQALAAVTPAADRAAAARAAPRAAHLEAEARRVEARLAQIRPQVAGMRQEYRLTAASRSSPAPRPAAPPRTVTRNHPVTISAPRTGLVAALWANAGKTAAPGAPLLEIVTPGWTRLQAVVPKRVLPSFREGASVTLRLGDGDTLIGRVARVQRRSDGAGRIEVIPPTGLRSGERVSLVTPARRLPRRTIPTAALLQRNGKTSLWVAVPAPDAGGEAHWIAHRRTVRTAPAGAGRVAIMAGLRTGDSVIVAGARDLREGQPVAPVEIGALRG